MKNQTLIRCVSVVKLEELRKMELIDFRMQYMSFLYRSKILNNENTKYN